MQDNSKLDGRNEDSKKSEGENNNEGEKKVEKVVPYGKGIVPREITEELRTAYLDYAMSVIVARALPDVRDGLKPVQRRILYAMWQEGLRHSTKFRKSATVVGTVLGHYHPHGDAAVYDAMARMAQDFSLRYPLVQGQGNFGSIDGDPPAAQRYTEARLSKISEEMLFDIEKETVPWQPNFDNTTEEPAVLPAKIPQLLLNGSMGIAVGMATNIPPHNLGEICDSLAYLIDNPEASTQDLFAYFKGPDFPGGGIVYDKKNLIEVYSQGRGSIVLRSKVDIVERSKDSFDIVVTEIPYGVLKSSLLEQIATLAKEKKTDDIKNIRDESDKDGLRFVVELKKGAIAPKVVNFLFKHTQLQKNFALNMVVLVDGIQPRVLSLKDVLQKFLEHRQVVVRRRCEFELKKALERVHILEGLQIALNNIDEVIEIIKKAKNRDEAKINLMKRFKFDDIQTEVILQTKLERLTHLEKQKIIDEIKELSGTIKDLRFVLATPGEIEKIIKTELAEIKENYADERRTKILIQGVKNLEDKDLIPEEENILVLTDGGYVKRFSPTSIGSQHRGGKGTFISSLREEDHIKSLLHISTHSEIFFFTNTGRVYRVLGYQIPEATKQSYGTGILNIVELEKGEEITSMLALSMKEKGKYLFMVTKKGIIKKTSLDAFSDVRRSGLRAINLDTDDSLVAVSEIPEGSDIMLFSKNGIAIRFGEASVSPLSRQARGVIGMRLIDNDQIQSMLVVDKKDTREAVIVSEKGYGKRVKLVNFKSQARGGHGIIAMKPTAKAKSLISAGIAEGENLMTLTQGGKTLRTELSTIPLLQRAAMGVKIITVSDGDSVKSSIVF